MNLRHVAAKMRSLKECGVANVTFMASAANMNRFNVAVEMTGVRERFPTGFALVSFLAVMNSSVVAE